MKRTNQQNKALQVYCRLLAETLNDSGLDMQTVLKPGVSIAWNEDMDKEYLWRPIQKIITGHISTTDPEPASYTEIYDTLNRHLAEKLGISVQWPSLENQYRDQLYGSTKEETRKENP